MRARAAVTGSVGALAGLTLLTATSCGGGAPRAAGAPAPAAERLLAGPGVALEWACVSSGPERCFDARDDNCNGVIDEGCGLRTGALQFVIAWEAPEVDLDLEVMDPDGAIAEVGRPTASGLVKERDCPGREGCQGQNYENVYLEGRALRGRYRVTVRLVQLGGAELPVRVTLGARVGPKSYAAVLTLTAPDQERSLELEL